MTPVREIVLQELEGITGVDRASLQLDTELYDEDLLDSLGTVELMVALGKKFGIPIPPSQVNRQMWSTPRKIIAYIEEKARP